ncbi:methyltransferase, FxLD system [Streptomyces sp. SAJ15]|nr:methyltransferase, FxLD system [Streptomyces sp. SAJ15]
MGSSDHTALPADATVESDSVGAVSTDMIATPDAAAERLRHALVDSVRKSGYACTPSVETAMRAVARHLFVPEASLEDAYANATVHIKYDGDGASISCASQPDIVALMLDQLQAQPGHTVLELGAGTGYNAGLLGHIVGETGHVTTIDVDQDLVDGARAHLSAAGIENVDVLLGDGALGHSQGAPYDRIIATVGAHGIPHAWMDQLTPGGRLVVAQRLRGSVCRSIAYERQEGAWRSVSSQLNTFVPLRQGIADDPRRMVPLTADGSVRVQINEEQAAHSEALLGVLDQPAHEAWSGVTFRGRESWEWMWLWLACTMDNALSRFEPDAPAVERGLVRPRFQYMAVVDRGAIGYLVNRQAEKDQDGRQLYEIGVVGHGPGADELVQRAVAEMRTWDSGYRDREVQFEIQPLGSEPLDPRPGRFAFDNALNRVLIEWQ